MEGARVTCGQRLSSRFTFNGDNNPWRSGEWHVSQMTNRIRRQKSMETVALFNDEQRHHWSIGRRDASGHQKMRIVFFTNPTVRWTKYRGNVHILEFFITSNPPPLVCIWVHPKRRRRHNYYYFFLDSRIPRPFPFDEPKYKHLRYLDRKTKIDMKKTKTCATLDCK